MKKTIRLTESELNSIIHNILTERIGVPDNILESSEIIYDELVSLINNHHSVIEGDDIISTTIHPRILIGDLTIHTIELSAKFKEHGELKEDIVYYLAQVGSTSKASNFNIKQGDDGSKIRINFYFAIKNDMDPSDVTQFLVNKKTTFVPILSHELHHAYFNKKTPHIKGRRKTEYDAMQEMDVRGVKPINMFFYLLYYTHFIENAVRPSEMLSSIKQNNITKSQFKKFLLDSNMFKTLKMARDYSYDGLKKLLSNHIKQIDTFFLDEIKDVSLLQLSDANKIEQFLKFIHIGFLNQRINNYKEFLTKAIKNPLVIENPLVILSDDWEELSERLNDEFKSYKKELSRYRDYDEFYKDAIKNLNYVGDKMIRRIAKLYDMVDDDNDLSEGSIHNWDLYHKINQTSKKTTNSVKKAIRGQKRL